MKKLIALVAFVVFGLTAANAQMAKFQALYIYNFAKNTGWPASDAAKDLVITVVGDNELGGELATLAKTKKIGNRGVVVNQVATVNGLPKSDIIFLGEAKSSQVGTLIANQAGNTVLMVSGKKGLCANGMGISFMSEGGKLNFEISQKNIKTNGLSLSQKVVALGKEVD